MRYLLEIEYDGSLYKGWQKQNNLKTIQGVIEEKLKILLKNKIEIFASGRTDAGVHALNQYAHFDYANNIDFYKFLYNINALLKNELIIIKNIFEVSKNFHARFSCLIKEYQYNFLISNKHNIFLNNRYWLIHKFDIQKANECAKILIGQHDFSSFRDSQCQANSPIKTIKTCEFIKNENLVIMKIQAKSFLHHQIRIIAGTISNIILKNKSIKDFEKILECKNRMKAGCTAPAKGLFLSLIKFDNEIINF